MRDSLLTLNSPENQSFVSKQLKSIMQTCYILLFSFCNDDQQLNVLIPSLRITAGQFENSRSIAEIS
jgi:hypothetical protein